MSQQLDMWFSHGEASSLQVSAQYWYRYCCCEVWKGMTKSSRLVAAPLGRLQVADARLKLRAAE
jgi:hypothetical protein